MSGALPNEIYEAIIANDEFVIINKYNIILEKQLILLYLNYRQYHQLYHHIFHQDKVFHNSFSCQRSIGEHIRGRLQITSVDLTRRTNEVRCCRIKGKKPEYK